MLESWLEPFAQAKGDRGPWRQAQWLRDGLLAVTGTDWQATGSVSGNVISETLHERPAGPEIVDTRTWQRYTLEPNADTVTVANGLLLATGTRWGITSLSASPRLWTWAGATVVLVEWDDGMRSAPHPLGPGDAAGVTAWGELVDEGRDVEGSDAPGRVEQEGLATGGAVDQPLVVPGECRPGIAAERDRAVV